MVDVPKQQMCVATTMSGSDLASAIHGRTYPDHPCFPQLKTAVDPALMLEIFREHLKPAVGRTLRIQECIPVKFRWSRSGSRCVLQYKLRLVDTGTEDLFHPWVTGVIYADAARTEQAKLELKAAGPISTIPPTLLTFEPLSFISELQMVVQVFPYERLMPNLPFILSARWPVLQKRLLACFGSGNWAIESQTFEPLRYHTGDTGVLRYTLQARNDPTSPTQTDRFYLKVYRTRHGEQTYQLLKQIRKAAAAGGKDFTAVEPLLYCSERRCLVLAEAQGRSLQEVFLGSGDIIWAVRRVARAMAAFSQTDIAITKCHSAEEQIDFLNRAAELLCWACPASAALVGEIVNKVSLELRDVPRVPIQWDPKPDHVFLQGERVTFVDLDTVSLGDPARDPAHLAAHITCRIDLPELPLDVARAAARELHSEYFSHVPSSWGEQFTLQYAIAVLEAACGLFKRQEPGWAERATVAIQEAERALSNGIDNL